MKKLVWLFIVAWICMNCQGQTPLSTSEKDSLSIFYQKRVKNFLRKSADIDRYLVVSQEGIRIFSFEGEENKKEKTEELSLTWEEALKLRTYFSTNPQKAYLYYLDGKISELLSQPSSIAPRDSTKNSTSLHGIRIALDPGHMAGSLAEATKEGKYIKITQDNGKKINFFESKLAWYTSRILADTLEKLGAEVMLTRNAYNLTALDSTYSDWLRHYQQENPELHINKWQFFFKTFKKIEFKKRVEKINAFKPHLTLIIHYNVDATNTGWTKPTFRNNSMAFVGGSFVKDELDKPEDRFNLLRLLLSEDIPSSIEFSSSILNAIDHQLHVKQISIQNKQFFLDKYCLYTGEPGVYHRNLTLSRQVFGTLCYAEPLYQDNIQECLKLSQQDLNYQEQKLPKRIQEVAYAYLRGILDYLNQKK